MPKYVFVTGGVVSSLGKGIVAASIGLLLKSRGFRVAHQKLDPYLNIDPGTMNPKEHGEVYVTEDGAETDLDLGYYERFTGVQTSRDSSFSAGKIYDILFRKERKGGEFFGKTIQVIPHLTNEIQNAIKSAGNEKTDVVIVEIGGTVGDIESFPFLEALRIFKQKEGHENTYFVHCTLIPYLRKACEIKTKPTQHSVAELRRIGIIPDMLVCRMEEEKHLSNDVREKLALFCNVAPKSVLGSFDYKNTIYEIPVSLAKQNIDMQILEHFRMPYRDKQIDEWLEYIADVELTQKKITIALVGKYTSVPDAYKSISESLIYSATKLKAKVNIKMISAEDLENPNALLKDADGILVAGGFGDRGVEGKIAAVRFARENNIPFFGICLGMQTAVVEFARNVCGLKDACSSEINPNTANPVISLMNSQKEVVDKGGTMRLGAYPCKLKDKSLATKLYGEKEVSERHRHRYEFNNGFRKIFEENGMVFSGLSPDGKLTEIIELPAHPFFAGVQFHPEFKSRPIKPHPLFTGFVEAAIKKQNLK